MSNDRAPAELTRLLRLQVYCRRILVALSTLSPLALTTHCGGTAVPEAQAPAPVTPGPPAAPPASNEATMDDAGETERSEGRANGVNTPIESYDLPAALAALADFDARLSASIELSAPDCDQAEIFRRAVCQLAERICVLEEGLPSSVVARECGDSRARCVAATSRFRQSCAP